jgi:hypothetical protein
MVRTTILVFALVACGSHSDTKPEADHHEMEDMPANLAQFHDVLVPLWHAPPGPARAQRTCEAIGDLKRHATEIAGAQELTAAIGELEHVCMTKGGDQAFDAAFGKVHDSFHHVLEASNK